MISRFCFVGAHFVDIIIFGMFCEKIIKFVFTKERCGLNMRGIDTQVRKMRRRIFMEVANLAYNSKNLKDDMEALPYKIINYDEPEHRENIYRERAIVRERIRLALKPLRIV